MTLDTLIGKKVTLVAYSDDLNIKVNKYGSYYTVSCTFIKYKFDNKLYILKVTENINDDNRSNLGEVTVVDETDSDYKNAVFQKVPQANVVLIHDDKRRVKHDGWERIEDVYEFIDDTGVVWFRFGTDNSHDYYLHNFFCYPTDIDLKSYRESILGDILDE